MIRLACALVLVGSVAQAKDSYPPLDVLLSTSETIIAQPFTYPEGEARITAVVVTMLPGKETGWHHHEVPLFAYILEGELTVDYGAHGTRLYRAGDSLIEAFKTRHNGRNTGAVPVRLIAMFAGAEGAANTVMDAQ